MSASDAVPLPRLGEVFFDVRGDSRSMRLSWYADTGVAVLSIWQGGMCAGTFRLAIGDLPRLVQTLRRGPAGQQLGQDFEAPAPDQPDYRTGAADYLIAPPGEQSAAPPDQRPVAAGYLADPADRRAAPTGYLADPADRRAAPTGYLPESPSHRVATGFEAEPTDNRTQYLADLPAPEPARTDSYDDPLSSGRRPGAWHQDSGGGAHSHGSGRHVSYPDELSRDPYPGASGPLDYHEPPAAHYQPGAAEGGNSVPGYDDVPSHPPGPPLTQQLGYAPGHPLGPPSGRPRSHARSRPHSHAHSASPADYPAHYAATVTGDVQHGTPGESIPYSWPDWPSGSDEAEGPPPGPDVPFN